MLVAFALVLVAAADHAPKGSGGREHVVTMTSMSFGRLPAGVKVGDTIVWANRDTVPHTATARDKSFDIRVPQGRAIRMVVRKAGTIPIYCIYHPAMRGSLKVAAS
jgi:plastocyanin